MNARMWKTAVGVLAGTLLPVSLAFPATAQKFSGSIVGVVSNTGGVPQMGASVLLYDRFERLLQRVLTTETGTFGFDSLPPEVYALRVSLASFLPAFKRNIQVQPGPLQLLDHHQRNGCDLRGIGGVQKHDPLPVITSLPEHRPRLVR